jgi:hypothetical protein
MALGGEISGKGMMISEGSGMQADLIAIIKATPNRPVAAMVAMMNVATAVMMLSSKPVPFRS